jgi:hypothetical protein
LSILASRSHSPLPCTIFASAQWPIHQIASALNIGYEEETVESDPDAVFEFKLKEEEDLKVGSEDVKLFHEILDKTSLHCLQASQVCELFAGYIAGRSNSSLSMTDFRQIMAGVETIEGGKGRRRRTQVASVLVNFFNAFDRSGSGYVDAREFACGLSLFTAGSKSEKLSFLSQLFERDSPESGDGHSEGQITRRGMWRYLRSILTALFAVCSKARAHSKNFHQLVDECIIDFVAVIFDDIVELEGEEGDPKRCSVNFSTFADWYTNGGYIQVPWLELLDSSKWPESPEV